MRRHEQLVANVRKRGRDIETGQDEYLAKHNASYYPILKKIFAHYKIDGTHILWLPIEDMENADEFQAIVNQINAKYRALGEKKSENI
jgi:deoxyadenosine/deoxycytidine kinase